MHYSQNGLEIKFLQPTTEIVTEGQSISGYASIFDVVDEGNDIVLKGAFSDYLAELSRSGKRVKMLWQHDPTAPIGVWDEVFEDEKGLFVRGRVLEDLNQGKEALTMLREQVIEGLSIGYKPIIFDRDKFGRRRLKKVELWEVSLVTFPMLRDASVGLVESKQNTDLKRLIKAMQELNRAFDNEVQLSKWRK